ncbi:MAG: 3-phosphoshikimate 1-carboxyvinyltransferase, partial [Lachnospiraceae bacterium]
NQQPRADLLVCSSSLHGIVIEGSVIPTLIDELTIIAIMAAFASGTTTIKDASELRVKESDRIQTISQNLLAMGGSITTSEDGMTIHGGIPLHGAYINSQKDHRIAMAFTIAALAAEGSSTISDSACVKVSYPDFYETLSSLL